MIIIIAAIILLPSSNAIKNLLRDSSTMKVRTEQYNMHTNIILTRTIN